MSASRPFATGGNSGARDDLLARRLHELGVRVTPHRRVIYDTLRATSLHPDAETLIHGVRQAHPEISVATVYNTLRLLERAHLIRAIEDPSGRTRYDSRPDHHPHFRCTRCGRLEDLPSADRRALPPPAGLEEHVITEVRVEFIGVCPACRHVTDPSRARQLGTQWS